MRLPSPYRPEADIVSHRLASLKGALDWAAIVPLATPGSPSRLAMTLRVSLPSTAMLIQALISDGCASGRKRTV